MTFQALAVRLVVLWLALHPSSVFAQSVESVIEETMNRLAGTVSTNANVETAGGSLVACTIEFAQLARDWTYKQGGFIRVGGSFGLMQAQGKTAVVLKVIVHDFDKKTNQTSPSPPVSSHLIGMKNETNRSSLVGYNPSDTPGGLFAVFQFSPGFEIIGDALARDKILIGFARRPNGMDIRIEVDLTVEETAADGTRKRSNRAALEFLECAKKLVRN